MHWELKKHRECLTDCRERRLQIFDLLLAVRHTPLLRTGRHYQVPAHPRESGSVRNLHCFNLGSDGSGALPFDGFLQRLSNEALVGNSCFGGGGSHNIEQLTRQPHVDSFALWLEFEADGPHFGKVVFRQVRFVDGLLGFLIVSEPWQFLFFIVFNSFLCMYLALIGRIMVLLRRFRR